MSAGPRALFVTGATGLIGGRLLNVLLGRLPELRVFVLVRRGSDWRALRDRLGPDASRCVPVLGDLLRARLGLSRRDADRLRTEVELVVHAAADTSFSQALDHARRVNVQGTERVVRLARACPRLSRFVHVSTAFVAGTAQGRVWERMSPPGLRSLERAPDAWVNAYEQSKYESELMVQDQAFPWMILRPSTVVCDDTEGGVSQLGAIHRALRLYHSGLASMIPGRPDTPVDVVTARYVAGAIADLCVPSGSLRSGQGPARDDDGVFHLCAGSGALPLSDLLNLSHRVWSESTKWSRRGVAVPALSDLDTYRRFEESVMATGSARIRRITAALTHFVPQLAFPKTFDTTRADSALGRQAPPVRDWWPQMVRHLVRNQWQNPRRKAG